MYDLLVRRFKPRRGAITNFPIWSEEVQYNPPMCPDTRAVPLSAAAASTNEKSDEQLAGDSQQASPSAAATGSKENASATIQHVSGTDVTAPAGSATGSGFSRTLTSAELEAAAVTAFNRRPSTAAKQLMDILSRVNIAVDTNHPLLRFRGISRHNHKWRGSVYVRSRHKTINTGVFSTPEEAAWHLDRVSRRFEPPDVPRNYPFAGEVQFLPGSDRHALNRYHSARVKELVSWLAASGYTTLAAAQAHCTEAPAFSASPASAANHKVFLEASQGKPLPLPAQPTVKALSPAEPASSSLPLLATAPSSSSLSSSSSAAAAAEPNLASLVPAVPTVPAVSVAAPPPQQLPAVLSLAHLPAALPATIAGAPPGTSPGVRPTRSSRATTGSLEGSRSRRSRAQEKRYVPFAYSGFHVDDGHGELPRPAVIVHHDAGATRQEAAAVNQLEGELGWQLPAPSQDATSNEPAGAASSSSLSRNPDASEVAAKGSTAFWRGPADAEWQYRVLRERQLKHPATVPPFQATAGGELTSGDIDAMAPPTRFGVRLYGERCIGEDADISAWRRAPLQRKRLPPTSRMFELVQQEAEAHRAFIAVRRIHLRAVGLLVGEDDEDDEDPHLVRAYAGHSAGGVEPRPSSSKTKSRLKALFRQHGNMTERDTDRIMRGLFFIDRLGTEDVHFGVCAGCGCGGNVVMCDTCACVWHESCSPDLASKGVPDGKWACPLCQLFPGHSKRLIAELRDQDLDSDADDDEHNSRHGSPADSDGGSGDEGGGGRGDADSRRGKAVLSTLASLLPRLQDVAGGVMISPDCKWSAILDPLHKCLNVAVISRGSSSSRSSTFTGLATVDQLACHVAKLPPPVAEAVAQAETVANSASHAAELIAKELEGFDYRGVSNRSAASSKTQSGFRVQLPHPSGSFHVLQARTAVQAARAYDAAAVALLGVLAPGAEHLPTTIPGGPVLPNSGPNRLWLNFPGRLPEYTAVAMLAWRIFGSQHGGPAVHNPKPAWLPDWQLAESGILVAALKAVRKHHSSGTGTAAGSFFAKVTPTQAVEFLRIHGFRVALGALPQLRAGPIRIPSVALATATRALFPVLHDQQSHRLKPSAAELASTGRDDSTVLSIRRKRSAPPPEDAAAIPALVDTEAAISVAGSDSTVQDEPLAVAVESEPVSVAATAALALALSGPRPRVIDPTTAITGVSVMRSQAATEAMRTVTVSTNAVLASDAGFNMAPLSGSLTSTNTQGAAASSNSGHPGISDASGASRRICKAIYQQGQATILASSELDPIKSGPTPLTTILEAVGVSRRVVASGTNRVQLAVVRSVGSALAPVSDLPAVPSVSVQAVSHGWRRAGQLAAKRLREPGVEAHAMETAAAEAAAMLSIWAAKPGPKHADGALGTASSGSAPPSKRMAMPSPSAGQRWLREGAMVLLSAGLLGAQGATALGRKAGAPWREDDWMRLLPDAVSSEDEDEDTQQDTGDADTEAEGKTGSQDKDDCGGPAGKDADGLSRRRTTAGAAPASLVKARRQRWASRTAAAIGCTDPLAVLRGKATGIGLAAVRALNGRPCLPSAQALATAGANHALVKGACRAQDTELFASVVDACGTYVTSSEHPCLFAIGEEQPAEATVALPTMIDVVA